VVPLVPEDRPPLKPGAAYLDIIGISCDNITQADTKSQSDPYVVVQCGGDAGRTPTVWNFSSPNWASRGCPTLEITGDPNAKHTVTLTVFDDDKKSSDKKLGSCTCVIDGSLGRNQEDDIPFAPAGQGKITFIWEMVFPDEPTEGFPRDAEEAEKQHMPTGQL